MNEYRKLLERLEQINETVQEYENGIYMVTNDYEGWETGEEIKVTPKGEFTRSGKTEFYYDVEDLIGDYLDVMSQSELDHLGLKRTTNMNY